MGRRILSMGCALLLFVSCVSSCCCKGDDSGNGSPTEEKKIQFSASQAGDGGEVEDYIASLLNKEFCVWSKKYRSNLGMDVFEGDRASYENSKWNYGDSKYWDLEMDYYRFCAYSDRGANLVGSSSASFEFFETQNVIDTGSFSKMYVAEDTVYKEKFCSVAKLDFKNMCSWIRFKFVNELSGNAKVKVIGFATNSDRNLKLVSDNVDGFVGSAKVRYVYGKWKPTYGDEGIVKKGNLLFGDGIVGNDGDSILSNSYRFDRKDGEYTKVFPTSTNIGVSSAKITFSYAVGSEVKGDKTIEIPSDLMIWEMNEGYTYTVGIQDDGPHFKGRSKTDIRTDSIFSISQSHSQGDARSILFR